MRVLKYAILGLLNQKSMSGYELSSEFESALNEFWNAKHSQIYPELRKLTEEGMITFETAITGNVLEKKIYTITEAGKKSFENGWQRISRFLRRRKIPFVSAFFFPMSCRWNGDWRCLKIT